MFLYIILIFTIFLSRSHCLKKGTDMKDLLKVVEGAYAYIDDFPYLVSVDLDGMHLCGGVLIRSNWVLTAAHCANTLSGDQLIRLSVQAGMTLTQDYNKFRLGTFLPPYPTINPVIGDATHGPEPLFAGLNSPNRKSVYAIVSSSETDITIFKEDVILLMLRGKFEFTKKMHPPEKWPSKPFMDSLKPGTLCTVAGWGWKADAFMNLTNHRRSANGKARRRVRQSPARASHSSSRFAQEGNVTDEHVANRSHRNSRRPGGKTVVNVYLNYAVVQLQDISWCRNQIAPKYHVEGLMQMCTNETGGANCRGDSGGPLICGGIPVGISSFGVKKCGKYNGYAVYTRIDYFLHWINKTVNRNKALRFLPIIGPEPSAAMTSEACSRTLVASCVSVVVFISGMYS